MYKLLSPTSMSMLISLLILTVALLANHPSFKDREKLSPFECGFSPQSSSRTPFSTRFFLLAVIFMVFDIEIILLFPAPIAMNTNMLMEVSTATSAFLMVLMLGLVHEWNEGSLEWAF